MKLSELIEKGIYDSVNISDNSDTITVTKPYACDLLSFAMSKAEAGCGWFTVMGNVNTIAVAVLTECACIILCEGAELDEPAAIKAKQQNVTVLKTDKPIFEAALQLHELLK